MTGAEVEGACEGLFASVAEAFHANFIQHQEIGASFCVVHRGRAVVDLWGGFANGDRSRPWTRDTLVNVWSTTKAITALCVARLAGQGRLEMDRPVADYWPEFGANGKDAITVAELFSHQAGLCGPSAPVTEAQFLDLGYVEPLFAAEAPSWPPGTRSGYHAFSLGPLAEGLFRRVTGKSVGRFFRDEIGDPLGVDVHLGLPESEDHRVSDLVHDGRVRPAPAAGTNPQQRRLQNMPIRAGLGDSRAWRALGTPSAGAQANARGLATLFSALATDRTLGGVELVSEAALAEATRVRISNEDLILGMTVSWGTGFWLNHEPKVYGPNPEAFGHHGWGGSFAFADPAAELGVAYAMNYMREPIDGPDPRVIALIASVYAALAAGPPAL
ncbi:serine hydrolase domain-containing protein [Phenylobacterium sp.]|uniref:serine hydrolase domain-containing protein n=1 Tax=Phenylobacterium sp. TaxID=1871053 RepID=UPI0035B2F268